MQQKTLQTRREKLQETKVGNFHAVKAKETPGGVIAMTKCKICGKPALYTLQSVFVCVPCKYIMHS